MGDAAAGVRQLSALADYRPPLRERLRAETRDAHNRVDRAFTRFDLTIQDGLAAFLTVHARVLPPIEMSLAIAGADRLLPDFAERRRARALMADLQALDAPWPGDPLPAPDFHGDAQMMGALYVLEGSRLGGAVLARQVAASPDARVHDATRYLRHGAERRFWSSFVATLNESPEAAARPDRVITAALDTFAAFEAALEEAA